MSFEWSWGVVQCSMLDGQQICANEGARSSTNQDCNFGSYFCPGSECGTKIPSTILLRGVNHSWKVEIKDDEIRQASRTTQAGCCQDDSSVPPELWYQFVKIADKLEHEWNEIFYCSPIEMNNSIPLLKNRIAISRSHRFISHPQRYFRHFLTRDTDDDDDLIYWFLHRNWKTLLR